jgi:Protein of unknown function (DUF2380)
VLNVNRILALALALLLTPAAALAGPKAIVFPFDLIDESQQQYEIGVMPQGVSDEEKRRLALITEELTKLLKADGRYDIVDTAPIAQEIDAKSPINKCNGCEDGLAKKAGAEVAFIGTVRKASDVLFTVSVYIRDVGQEKVTRQASSEIYGNTDAMWLRSVRYIVQKRLFPEGASQ